MTETEEIIHTPEDIEEALLSWFDLAYDTDDDYWSVNRWNIVRYSSYLGILFLRCTDPKWERRNYPEREGEIARWIQDKTGRNKLLVGYLTPYRANMSEK